MAKMMQQPTDLLEEEQDDEEMPDETPDEVSPEDESEISGIAGVAPMAAAQTPAGKVPVIAGKNGDIPIGIEKKGKNERDELKQKLYQDLQKRLDPGSDINQKQLAIRKDLREQQGSNDVIAALNRGAAMAGSVGGKYADTSGVERSAQSFNRAAAEDVGDLSAQQAQKDKLNEYLLSQMNSQDLNQAKIANQNTMLNRKIEGAKEVAGVRAKTAKELLDGRLAQQAGMKTNSADQQASKMDNTDAQKLAGALKGTSRDSIGSNQAKVNSAERINALIDSAPGGNLDQRQMRELATSLASLLSNGAATQTQIDELVPKSAQGNADKLYEYMTGIPQGVNQQAFVQRMRDTVERERDVAKGQLLQARAGVLSGYSRLRKSNPDVWNDIAAQNGFDPQSDFDDKGRYKSKAVAKTSAPSQAQGLNSAEAAGGGNSKMDPKIAGYAQSHQLDYNTARNLLKNRGYQPNE